MWDKCVGVLSVLGLAYYSVQVWRRRYRGLPRRFRCLECKRLYRSIESKSRFDTVFCSPRCEQVHQAEVRHALKQL